MATPPKINFGTSEFCKSLELLIKGLFCGFLRLRSAVMTQVFYNIFSENGKFGR